MKPSSLVPWLSLLRRGRAKATFYVHTCRLSLPLLLTSRKNHLLLQMSALPHLTLPPHPSLPPLPLPLRNPLVSACPPPSLLFSSSHSLSLPPSPHSPPLPLPSPHLPLLSRLPALLSPLTNFVSSPISSPLHPLLHFPLLTQCPSPSLSSSE